MKYALKFFMTTPDSAPGGTGTLTYQGGDSCTVDFDLSGGKGQADATGKTVDGVFNGAGNGVQIRISKNPYEAKNSVAANFAWGALIYNYVGGAI